MYWAIARLALQRQLSYRAANLAGLATNVFFGVLRAAVIAALFAARQNQQVAGYSVQQAVTFTGLTQALMTSLAVFGWWDLMRTIRSGEVASDLARPYDYYWYWWAQDLGRALGHLLFRALPIMLLYAIFYPITLPPSGLRLAALTASLVFGLSISFSWRFMVSLAAFWTQDAVGVGRLAWTLSTFFSGFLMPLTFFPPWATALLRATPFAGMLNTVLEIYLGVIDDSALLGALAWQVFWVVVLYTAARLVLAAGVRKLVIQGG